MTQGNQERTTERIVGRRVPRLDGPAMASGKALYAADFKLPGMLYGRCLRCPHPHAKIKWIDIRRAAALPGVRAVITAADVPGGGVLARDEVGYEGQKVAAVAADTPEIAEEAVALIDVEYEVLPAVVDLEQALRPDAPPVRLDAPVEEVTDAQGRPLRNVRRFQETAEGDWERALAEADVVVEGTFRAPTISQVYLELHAALVRPEPDGRFTVWSGAQGIFMVRSAVAQALGLPLQRVKVIGAQVGGAFGGKNACHVEPIAAVLAWKTGRPVRVVDTRAEVFLDSHPGPGFLARARLGAKRDGTITALDAEMFWDGGCYGGGGGAGGIRGLYHFPTYRLRGYGVYTNTLPPGPYRAPSAPQQALVREGMMDLLARELNLDPLELRLKNIPPTENGAALADTLRAVAEKAGWAPERPGQAPAAPIRRGRGLAAGDWTNWDGCSAATVILNENGSFEVLMGSVNLTGTSTVFAQIAAEELGVPVESVTVTLGDTDSVPYHDVSGGSRTAYATGTAVQRAAQGVREQLLRRGAALLGARPEEVEIADRRIRKRDDPEESVTFAELGQNCIRMPEGPIQASSGLGELPARPSYAAQIAEVEVDVETGQVKVVRFVAAQDVGRALNPTAVEGQIQGAVAQGIGWALWEGYRYDERGRLANPNLLDYPIATAHDLPPIETVLVETHPAGGPYGAKGVGEPPIVPAPAAVMNAVADALGVPVGELPLTPERVVRAWRKRT